MGRPAWTAVYGLTHRGHQAVREVVDLTTKRPLRQKDDQVTHRGAPRGDVDEVNPLAPRANDAPEVLRLTCGCELTIEYRTIDILQVRKRVPILTTIQHAALWCRQGHHRLIEFHEFLHSGEPFLLRRGDD